LVSDEAAFWARYSFFLRSFLVLRSLSQHLVPIPEGLDRLALCAFPDLTIEDFPVGPTDDKSLDLLAICRGPR